MDERRFRLGLGILALIAAARVFAWSAAFPFFNPIDEHLHFDVVQKYSRGFLPGREEARFDATSATLIVEHSTREYVLDPAAPPPDESRPIARRLATQGDDPKRKPVAIRALTGFANIEADAPPAYYAVAGLWLRLGRALGIEELRLVYWVRFLDPLVMAAAVVVAGLALRAPAAGDAFLALGPAAIVALWPNEIVHSITPDVLSILLGGLVFGGLVRIARGGASEWTYALTGLALGVAFLNKYSNVSWIAAAALVLVVDVRRQLGAGVPRKRLFAPWTAFAIQAALPAGWWLVRNLVVIGSLSGQDRKLEWLHWTPKPLAALLDHPLIGFAAWPGYLHTLVRTFWTGESGWHGGRGSHPGVDDFLVATTALFALAAVLAWRSRVPSRAADAIAWAGCLAAVAVMAVLSLSFDFGIDEGPVSRAQPFLAAGRLIASTLIPFAWLACRGVDWLWSWTPAGVARAGRWATLAAVLAVATAGELAMTGSAFASPSNWYRIR